MDTVTVLDRVRSRLCFRAEAEATRENSRRNPDLSTLEADMKTTITKSMTHLAVVVSLIFGAGHAFAAPPFVVPQGPPVWCFGLNELDQCVLYLGTAETCRNLAPCSDASLGLPTTGLTFCFGADEVTGECKVFLGSEERCDSLEPCRAVGGLLPRADKQGPPTSPR